MKKSLILSLILPLIFFKISSPSLTKSKPGIASTSVEIRALAPSSGIAPLAEAEADYVRKARNCVKRINEDGLHLYDKAGILANIALRIGAISEKKRILMNIKMSSPAKEEASDKLTERFKKGMKQYKALDFEDYATHCCSREALIAGKNLQSLQPGLDLVSAIYQELYAELSPKKIVEEFSIQADHKYLKEASDWYKANFAKYTAIEKAALLTALILALELINKKIEILKDPNAQQSPTQEGLYDIYNAMIVNAKVSHIVDRLPHSVKEMLPRDVSAMPARQYNIQELTDHLSKVFEYYQVVFEALNPQNFK